MCNCDICQNPEQHERRKRFAESHSTQWACMLTMADMHRCYHRIPLLGCQYCEGKEKLIHGIPELRK